MENRTGGRRGFTLIELLVVIAIIAILAAILFPVFARARENARKSTCQSNLKQISLAFVQYRQDYDERMPGSWTGGGAAYPGIYQWPWCLAPYMKNWQVFVCPSDPSRNAIVAAADPRNNVSFGYGTNVAYYNGSGVAGVAANHPMGKADAEIGDVSGTIVVFDNAGFERGWADAASQGGTTAASLQPRHSDGLNFGFYDGHVKWMQPTAALQTHAQGIRPYWSIQSD